MSPTRSSDAPPPRPNHICSVEENITNFRRCYPDSTYNYIPISVFNPKRPSSRTSSVHSSDDEGLGVGSGDRGTVDLSQRAKGIDQSLDRRTSVTSKGSDAEGTQDDEHSPSLFRVSFEAVETCLDAMQEEMRGDLRASESTDSHERLSRKKRNSVNSEHAGAVQDATRGTRSSQPQGEIPFGLESPVRIGDYSDTTQTLSIESSSPPSSFSSAGREEQACEWCCEPALDGTDVCAVHQIKEQEEKEEEEQQDMAIISYRILKKEQLAKTTAEKTVMGRETVRHKDSQDTDKEKGLLKKEIRDTRSKPEKKRTQVQRPDNLLARLPIPSLKIIVRAHHGKITTYSQRDPAGRVAFQSKRCSCKDYRRHLSNEATFV